MLSTVYISLGLCAMYNSPYGNESLLPNFPCTSAEDLIRFYQLQIQNYSSGENLTNKFDSVLDGYGAQQMDNNTLTTLYEKHKQTPQLGFSLGGNSATTPDIDYLTQDILLKMQYNLDEINLALSYNKFTEKYNHFQNKLSQVKCKILDLESTKKKHNSQISHSYQQTDYQVPKYPVPENMRVIRYPSIGNDPVLINSCPSQRYQFRYLDSQSLVQPDPYCSGQINDFQLNQTPSSLFHQTTEINAQNDLNSLYDTT